MQEDKLEAERTGKAGREKNREEEEEEEEEAEERACTEQSLAARVSNRAVCTAPQKTRL